MVEMNELGEIYEAGATAGRANLKIRGMVMNEIHKIHYSLLKIFD